MLQFDMQTKRLHFARVEGTLYLLHLMLLALPGCMFQKDVSLLGWYNQPTGVECNTLQEEGVRLT